MSKNKDMDTVIIQVDLEPVTRILQEYGHKGIITSV